MNLVLLHINTENYRRLQMYIAAKIFCCVGMRVYINFAASTGISKGKKSARKTLGSHKIYI